MLEQRQQRQRRQLLGYRLQHQAQKHSGRRLAQLRAGGIVDLDAPAPQLAGDAARQLAVGRHQRRGLARLLQALTHQKCYDRRLFLRPRTVDTAQAGERRFVEAFQRAPAVAQRSRAQRFGDELVARCRRRGEAGRRPILDVLGRDSELGQKPRQQMLRVCGILRDRLPAFGIAAGIESRQHHGALRHRRHHGDELGHRRDRAGNAGGDHR